MDVRDMTPAQLRAMADEMESKSVGVTADEHERRISVLRGGAPDDARREDEHALEKMWEDAAERVDAPKRPGYMRHVTVDGIAVDVDMRVIADIRTMRIIADVQGKDDAESAFAAIKLFDRILGDQREAVEAALSDADGFCPVDRYVTFAMRLFEAVGAKN